MWLGAGRQLGIAPQYLKVPNGELRTWRSEFLIWLEPLHKRAA
jgi:hypothetical protein